MEKYDGADLDRRCVLLGEYLLSKRSTVRDAARTFGISKSTVHKDVTEKLPHVSPSLYAEVRRLLSVNKAERHLRGGQATKEKYRRVRAGTDCGEGKR